MHSKYKFIEEDRDSSFYYISREEQTSSNNWHDHDYYELHYFDGILGESHIGDYTGPISPKTLFLLAPNLPRSWNQTKKREANASDLLILFPKDLLSNVHLTFPEIKGIKPVLDDARFGIKFTQCREVEEIGRIMEKLSKLEGCARLGHFFSVLDKLMRIPYKRLSTYITPELKETTSSSALNRALFYIKNNLHENITLKSVARISNMSPTHFSRSFKKHYNIGFLEYVNKLRIEKACNLLIKTNKPISSIGYECGFSNISNFNRNFKKYTNKSPTEFRQSSQTSSPHIPSHTHPERSVEWETT